MNKKLNTSKVNKDFLIFFSLLVIAFFIFQTSFLNHNYFWDDERFVFLNPELLQAPHWYSFWEQGSQFTRSWPLGFSIFWFIIKILPSAGIVFFKSLNVFLHTSNAFLLYKIFKKMNFFEPFFLCLFFLVHPMHVEVVSWVFQLLTILSFTFFLLSYLAIVYFIKNKNYLYLLLSFFYLMLSLWTKSISLFVPIFYLFLFWYFEMPLRRYLFLIPFFIGSLYLGLLNLKGNDALFSQANQHIDSVNYGDSGLMLNNLPTLLPFQKDQKTFSIKNRNYYDFIYKRETKNIGVKFNRIEILKQGSWHYVKNLFLPYDLKFIYPTEKPPLIILVFLIVFSLLAPLIFFIKTKQKYLLYIPIFIFVFLAPYLGTSFISFFYWSNVSDRYAYYFIVLLPVLISFIFKPHSSLFLRRSLLVYLSILVMLNFKHGVIFNKPILMYEEIIKYKPHPVIYNLLFEEYFINLKISKAENILSEGLNRFPNDIFLKDSAFRLEVMKKNFNKQ